MSTWKHKAAALTLGLVVALALVALQIEPTLVQPAPTEAGIADFEDSEIPTEPWVSSEEGLDCLEAAFRYQFKNNDLNPKAVKESAFVFLALKDRDGRLVDLPPALLSRFGDLANIEPVLKADLSGFGIKHHEKEGRCVLFVIENVRMIDESTFEVGIGYHGGCSSGNAYRFRRRDGRWVKVSGGARFIT